MVSFSFFVFARLLLHTVIRGLALGTLNDRTRNQFLMREIKMAASLSLILSIAGFLRAILFKTPVAEALTVGMSGSCLAIGSGMDGC